MASSPLVNLGGVNLFHLYINLKYWYNQNAFGAVYSGRRWLWFRGRVKDLSMLTIEENCRKLDTPCICLTQGKLAVSRPTKKTAKHSVSSK
jgi:hypothetical protein